MKPNRLARQRQQTRNAIIMVAVVAVVAAAAIAVVHFRGATPQSAAPPAGTGPAAPGGKVWGRDGAPVTIEVYSDFL